jgi:hypothetical protein
MTIDLELIASEEAGAYADAYTRWLDDQPKSTKNRRCAAQGENRLHCHLECFALLEFSSRGVQFEEIGAEKGDSDQLSETRKDRLRG